MEYEENQRSILLYIYIISKKSERIMCVVVATGQITAPPKTREHTRGCAEGLLSGTDHLDGLDIMSKEK